MRKINVSIVGAGKIAEEHIRAFSVIKNYKIVGICSRTRIKAKKLQKKYNILRCYNSIEDLNKYSNSNLVIVAVSLENLWSVYTKVLSYNNWSCLLEKPVGLNCYEAKKIISTCKDPKKAFVSLNRYSYSTTKKILKYLNKDKSKRLIHIFDQENFYKIKNKKIKKNWMYCNSIHLVDYCRFLARGKLLKIKILQRNKDYNFVKYLEFSSGDRIVFTSIWNKPGPWSVKISTKHFFLDLQNLENLFVSGKKVRNKKITLNYSDKKFKPGFLLQAKELKKFLSNKIYPNLPNILDAYKTMLLTKRIYEKN